MTSAPNTSQYLLVNPDTVDLPDSRILVTDPVLDNLQLIDSGPGGAYALHPTLNLLSIVEQSAGGMMAYTGTHFTPRTFQSVGNTIAITNPSGVLASPSFDVVNDTTTQRVIVQSGGTPTTNPRASLNFINGLNVTVATVDNSALNRTDITINAATGIAANASVVLTSSSTGHSFDLGSLSSGLLKIGVVGDVATPATAIAGTDYLAPTPTLEQIGALVEVDGDIITGSGGAWVALGAGVSGYILSSQGPGMPLTWAPSTSGSTATFLTQTGSSLPVNGINLGAVSASLGIGTTTPGQALDVIGNIRTSGNLLAPTGSALIGGNFESTGGGVNVSAGFVSTGGGLNVTSNIVTTGGGLNVTSNIVTTGGGVTASGNIASGSTITAGGQLTVGGIAPSAQVTVYSNTTEDVLIRTISDSGPRDSQIIFANYAGATSNGSNLFLQTASGTYASASPIGNNINVANIAGLACGVAGSNGSEGYNVIGDITFTTTQPQTGSNGGGSISIRTTPNNTTLPITAIFIDQTGHVGMGTTTPAQVLSVVGNITATGSINGNQLGVYSNNSGIVNNLFNIVGDGGTFANFTFTNYAGASTMGGPQFVFRQANATQTSPSVTLTGDILGKILAEGYNGSAFTSESASISFNATQAFTAGNGSKITFSTTPNGSTTDVVALTIGNIGGSNALVQFAQGFNFVGGATADFTGATVIGLPSGSVTSVAITAPAFTVTGSPITTAGTINLALNTIPIASGGTGQTTHSAAFNALSPITTLGDIIVGTGTNTASRLGIGSSGQVLTVSGGTLVYATPAATGVTSVAATSSDLTIGGSPITSSGTLTFSLNTVGIAKGGTGQTTALAAYNALAAGIVTSAGDLIYATSGTTNTRVGIGTVGQVLTVGASNTLTYTTPSSGAGTPTFLLQNATNGTTTNSINLGAGGASLGIGTASPTSNLHVIGNAHITTTAAIDGLITANSGLTATSGNIQVTGGGSLIAGTVPFVNATMEIYENNNGVAMNIYADGSAKGSIYINTYNATPQPSILGLSAAIGTFASSTPIQSGAVVGQIIGYAHNETAAFDGASSGGYNPIGQILFTTTQIQTTANGGGSISFQTSPNNSVVPVTNLFIDQSGFVGIGSSAVPSNPLTVYSSTNQVPLVTTADAGTYGQVICTAYTGSSPFGNAILVQGARGSQSSPSPVVSGDFIGGIAFQGYGTSFLDGSGSSIFSVASETAGANHGSDLRFFYNPVGSASNAEAMRINGTSGNIGILNMLIGSVAGLTGPVYQIQLTSDLAAKPTSALWTIVSDARIKTNVVDTEEALPIINAIKTRKYCYTEDHINHMKTLSDGSFDITCEDQFYGIIADELETSMPTCVKVSAESSGTITNLKAINLHNVMILSFKAIQELSALVTAQAADITALKAKVGM